MVRDMGVRKNIHIENWASHRENLEHVFKFSRGNWARFAVFGILVPIAMYKGIVTEFHTEGQGTNVGPESMGIKRKYWMDGRNHDE